MIVRSVCAAALIAAFAGPAFAQGKPLTPTELDGYRGGFIVAGEVTFDFGAVVRTFENGALVLQSQVAWTPGGPVVQRIAADGVAVDTSSRTGAELGSTFTTSSGAALIQRVTGGEISNILLNAQSGRSFRQETDVTLTLPGFEGMQSEIGRNLSTLRLADDLETGAINAVGK